ncbi:MAG: ATP-binding protein [Ruminococcus sp.]|nr:ATP-binding protein [Ruminococcus sp.]
MEFNLPNYMGTDRALRMAAALNEYNLSDGDDVNIKASMKWVRPFGMLVSANALRNFRKRFPNNSFCLTYKPSSNGVSYAGHMGFFKSFSDSIAVGNAPGEAPGSENYIPITKFNLRQLHIDNIIAGIWGDIGDTIERKSGELSTILCRDNKELHYLMTYLIREILRNIPEHADASDAWICGQYWSNHTAEIAILDTGIGIKRSLQKNAIHRKYVVDDLSALECAVKAGISQAFNPARGNKNDDVWSNSGYGLFMVSEICKKLNGSFCIASGNSYLYIYSDGRIKVGDTHIDGTAIKMGFSTQQLHSGKEIIAEIASLGEAQARTIQNAFQQASTPSKGLITGA